MTRDRILRTAQGLILERGYGGTSLADIVGALGITKGAFFHHFAGKDDLARALIERYAERDREAFAELERRVDEIAGDPVQAALLLVGLIEDRIAERERPMRGCLFAAYIYQQNQFEPEIRTFLRSVFEGWFDRFERRFEAALEVRPPRIPVTGRELAEQFTSVMEGAVLLGRVFDDPRLIARQIRQFRQYLKLVLDV